jgi:Ribonuclease G/E
MIRLPLFARYGVESYLASMFNPVVQLPRAATS